MQDDIPEEYLVAEMVQYGKERLEAAGYVPYYLYRQLIYERAVREYWLYCFAWQSVVNIIFRSWKNVRVFYLWDLAARLSGCGAPEYRQLKQHMPKDVDVYHVTIDALLEKRHRICENFGRLCNGYKETKRYTRLCQNR